MQIEKYLQSKKKLIDKEMQNAVPKKISKKWIEFTTGKADYSFEEVSINFGISKPIWDLLSRGGKRWRPALTLICCEAVGGTEKNALPFTPLPELLHNGTLMVDDIEDGSIERRGKPATHLIYGEDIAINAGSALYFLPLTILYRNSKNLSDKKKIAIYDLFGEEMVRVSLGQAMDISWHKGVKKNVSENHYLQMCVYKTGVLARFSAKLGAIIGNGSLNQIEALGKFGEALGLGFQIQDDILNIKPKSNTWGKRVGEDITEGKRTLLTIRASQKLSKKEAKELENILKKHSEKKKDIKRAIQLIEKTDAIEYAEKKANKIVSEAWEKLEKVLSESKAKKLLKDFAYYCIERKV